MKRRIFVLTFSLLILSLGVAGCDEATVRSTVTGKALDRKVLKLQTGASTEEVRSKLGKPRLEKDLGEEEVLYYGLWQLVFTDRGLGSRTRDYKAGYGQWAYNSKALERKVLLLPPGTSIEYVRAKLGTPEALEIDRDPPHKEESLWYGHGRWKLSFTDGDLIRKAKF